MRKLAVALGAAAIALSSSFYSASAQEQPSKSSVSSSVKSKKKVAKRSTTPKVKYAHKCKAGERWNAQATAFGGACEKRTAKVKVKKPSEKAAGAPAKTRKVS